MTNQYEGMRWLKCDLQMQTPADTQHWAGDRIISGKEAESAKLFAEACFHSGLDVIGITDHNFLSKKFIPYLKIAFKNIESEKGHKTTMFPGFEFEAAGVGRGVHILCLFEPETDLAKIDSILTECGVSYPRTNEVGRLEKSDKNLKQILRIVQDKYSGIVILPHATSNDGIFDNDSVSEWLQQDQFVNPELLALEVPKPVHLMSSGYRKLLRSGIDCAPGWKRIRPIATLMSSDNKKLIEVDENSKPLPNSIGYRYSWIKMSKPSIESLRQAFLDHDSRIILPEDVSKDIHPSQRFRQSRIKSIIVKNVSFLADQELHFSSNMTCIIGGRGSGKSTLLEYLRILMGKDKSTDIDKGTKVRIDRVRDTLNEPLAEVEVIWINSDGIEDQIVWKNGNATVLGRNLADPETFFNNLSVRFYSQQQLNRLTESQNDDGSVRQAQRLLDLVDGFAANELEKLAIEEHKLKLKIQDSFTNLRKAKTLEKDRKRLQQEQQELDRQWKARSEIQEDARLHTLLKSEAHYLDGIMGTPGKQFTEVLTLAKSIADSHISFQVPNSPHEVWFKQFDSEVRTAKETLINNIRSEIEKFENVVINLKSDDPSWPPISEEIEQADARFNEACEAKGLSIDDVGRLQEINQFRSNKQREIDETESEILRLEEAAGDIDQLMKNLHEIWRAQFCKRVEAADRANELAVLNEGEQRFIEVTANYQQDFKSFFELWQSFSPSDGRTKLGRNWESFGENLYSLFIEREKAESPWQVLYELMSMEEGLVNPDFEMNTQELFLHIQENPEQWEKLRCSRVQDSVDMKLFRADGTTAGTIAEGSLSDGQRNTAALALLLAQEGGPLVIDQPEDELDSNFVFRELIPMLRKVKTKRQIIMATHNANLPVNGDAELVFAFEAQQGKGEALACGGLDQPSVTKAVLDIMEGTEEAFRRRREKYHF